MSRSRRVVVGITVAALTSALVGCSSASTPSGVAPVSSSAPAGTSSPPSASPTSATPTSSAGSTTPSTSASPAASLPPVTDPVSLPALMRDTVTGSALRLGRVLDRTDAYTKYAVSYRSDSLTITGIMDVPKGSGPFPVVVLLHGHIDEDVYVTGQGFRREQDSLARHGYVAFHIDYRNHAGSDDDPRNDVDLRLGYARDAIAAVEAVTTSSLRFLDGSRIGIIGRSMGGGVAFNALVARPDLVDAVVTYASVSTNAVDNYNRWIRYADGRRTLVAAIDATHGSPQQNPAFWTGISSRSFLSRITTPVLMHQGVADDTCPVAWARATAAALRAGKVDLTYYEYPGENHYMLAAWSLSMQRTLAFLKTHLVT